MIAHYEGYGSGVTKRFPTPRITARHYRYCRELDTMSGPNMSAAIETALGDAAEYIVVEDRNAAHQAINHLREQKRGRATFIIKSELDSWSKDHKIGPSWWIRWQL